MPNFNAKPGESGYSEEDQGQNVVYILAGMVFGVPLLLREGDRVPSGAMPTAVSWLILRRVRRAWPHVVCDSPRDRPHRDTRGPMGLQPLPLGREAGLDHGGGQGRHASSCAHVWKRAALAAVAGGRQKEAVTLLGERSQRSRVLNREAPART